MKEGVVSSLINSQASPNTHSYNKESPHLMVWTFTYSLL